MSAIFNTTKSGDTTVFSYMLNKDLAVKCMQQLDLAASIEVMIQQEGIIINAETGDEESVNIIMIRDDGAILHLGFEPEIHRFWNYYDLEWTGERIQFGGKRELNLDPDEVFSLTPHAVYGFLRGYNMIGKEQCVLGFAFVRD